MLVESLSLDGAQAEDRRRAACIHTFGSEKGADQPHGQVLRRTSTFAPSLDARLVPLASCYSTHGERDDDAVGHRRMVALMSSASSVRDVLEARRSRSSGFQVLPLALPMQQSSFDKR